MGALSIDTRAPRRSQAEPPQHRPCASYPGSFQRAPDITLQGDKIAFACAVAPDQHQVDPGYRTLLQQQSRGLLQPAPGAITDHGVADFLRHGEAQPSGEGVRACQGLEDDTAYRGFLASGG